MILLTGGAGFIGSCFLKKLNEQGINDIIVVDRLSNGSKWRNLVGKKYIDYIHKDNFLDLIIDNNLAYSIDTIIHFGACSNTTETNVDYFVDNNFNYSRILANYAIENNIRFIYASSAATYGLGENGYSDNTFEQLKPLNPYGWSKQIFDLWIIENKLSDKVVGLKFFNVFGPNEYHKADMSSMIYKAYHQVINTGKINLFKSNSKDYADGEQQRDFVYIKDINEILWKIYNDKNINGIFNLGTGTARSWNDLAKSVFKALDKKECIEYFDMPEKLYNQYQNYTQADMSKFNQLAFDYKFQSLEDSVADYINNYLKQNWQNY